MTTTKKLSLLSLLAVGIAPGVAAADHPRDRDASAWVQLGNIGTHTHDAEDYVPVTGGQHLRQLQIVARQRPVALDRVQIQFTDGHSEFIEVRRRIMPDQSITLDLPPAHDVKMLVLDYGNVGPYWRARETARVEVNGLVGNERRGRWQDRRSREYDNRYDNGYDSRYDNGYDSRYDNYDNRYDNGYGGAYQAPITVPPPVIYTPPARTYVAPTPPRTIYVPAQPTTHGTFVIRGGVRVRL